MGRNQKKWNQLIYGFAVIGILALAGLGVLINDYVLINYPLSIRIGDIIVLLCWRN